MGTVLSLGAKNVVVMTSGGVGYNVLTAGSLLAELKEGGKFEACIHTIVKETEISLYGFGNDAEKALFEKLIGVSGIGPKTAIAMVSTPTEQFMRAVSEGDVPFLTKLPGLGKKTAERLIVELRGKLNLEVVSSGKQSPAMDEAIDALKNLGYDKSSIVNVLKEAPENAETEDLVKFFLSLK